MKICNREGAVAKSCQWGGETCTGRARGTSFTTHSPSRPAYSSIPRLPAYSGFLPQLPWRPLGHLQRDQDS